MMKDQSNLRMNKSSRKRKKFGTYSASLLKSSILKVKYTAPPSAALRRKDIVPSVWGDKFNEEDGIVTTH